MRVRLAAGVAAVTLCLTAVSPAMAQEYRFSGADAPRGASATVSLRVPLGAQAPRQRASLGFAVGYGRQMGSSDRLGPGPVAQLRVADLRLDRGGLSRAELATFDLTRPDRDTRLQLVSENKKNVFWLALIAASGLVIFLLVSGGNSSSETDPPPTIPPVGD